MRRDERAQQVDHVPRIGGRLGRLVQREALTLEQARIADRAIAESTASDAELAGAPLRLAKGATPQGEAKKLRGIPVLAPGVVGTAPGTNPLAETLKRDGQRRRRINIDTAARLAALGGEG